MKIVLSLFVLMSAAKAMAFRESSLVCFKGKPQIFATTYDTGCVYPPVPYLKTLFLEATSAQGGRIVVEIAVPFPPQKNPQCSNPRGMPYFHYLPLPISEGQWEVQIGKVKSLVNMNEGCSVQ